MAVTAIVVLTALSSCGQQSPGVTGVTGTASGVWDQSDWDAATWQ